MATSFPVLLHGDVDAGVVLCHYHLDRQRLMAALRSAKLAGSPFF
jgi:hypothetical protein